jgi:hypothetical protein
LLCVALVAGFFVESIVSVAEAWVVLVQLAIRRGLRNGRGLQKLWVYVRARQRCTKKRLFGLAPQILPQLTEPRRVALGLYEERAANRLRSYDLRQLLAGRSEVVRRPYCSAGQQWA